MLAVSRHLTIAIIVIPRIDDENKSRDGDNKVINLLILRWHLQLS